MRYTMKQGKDNYPVFILLHGTGGNELSLLEVGKDLHLDATLIGIRGNVSEQGLPRFFKRLSEGVYDEVDLELRAKELHTFIHSLLQDNHLTNQEVVLVGYSNGANIAIKLLLDYPKVYQRAVLFHPMYPVTVSSSHDLHQTKVFATLGVQDTIVPIAESKRVIELFQRFGASMTLEWTLTHQLTYPEVEQAKKWLNQVL